MNNEPEKKENTIAENLKAVGQEILGEIELIGGILTGDSATRAEGEFNLDVGAMHQEANKNLTAIDNQTARGDEGGEE